MNKRQFLVVLVPIAVIVVCYALFKVLAEPKARPSKQSTEEVNTVFASEISLGKNVVYLESTGLLEAKNRVDLYSEVQGLMEADGGKFRAGNRFSKGEKLISIQNDDRLAAVVSQRSKFQSSLSAVMPDIRVDFAEDFAAWNEYLSKISVDKALSPLPAVSNQNLKAFLTGRGIYSEYYSVKNAEISFDKYQIYAPFAGVLTEATVDPGTVIRPGQKLGRFIQPGTFEMECQINIQDLQFIQISREVRLYSAAFPNKSWTGKITRINNAINASSQMCTVIILVEAADLKDGMFLEAKIKARELDKSFALPRSAMVDGNKVFVVEKGLLALKTVEVLYRGENECILGGLPGGSKVLSKVPPAAFEGMKVKIYSKTQA